MISFTIFEYHVYMSIFFFMLHVIASVSIRNLEQSLKKIYRQVIKVDAVIKGLLTPRHGKFAVVCKTKTNH